VSRVLGCSDSKKLGVVATPDIYVSLSMHCDAHATEYMTACTDVKQNGGPKPSKPWGKW
jgi:hypothetical protein